MNYTAEHIDTEKFEAGLENNRKYQEKLHEEAIKRATAEFQGYCKCLEEVRGMLHCSNYESNGKETVAYQEGADAAFYKLCKELDIMSQDIRDMDTSVDEKTARLASRIRKNFLEEEMKNRMHDYTSGINVVLSAICGKFGIECNQDVLCREGEDPAEKAIALTDQIKETIFDKTPGKINWVSVEKATDLLGKNPGEEFVRVIVYGENGAHEAVYDTKANIFRYAAVYFTEAVKGVTHWAIFNPPKKEQPESVEAIVESEENNGVD